MSIEEKYQKASIDYWLALISRKFLGTLSAYPEFVFMIKILIGIVVAFLIFTLIGKFIGH